MLSAYERMVERATRRPLSNPLIAGHPTPIPEEFNAISRKILDGAYRVHRALGPGLFENVYRTCLGYELEASGLKVEREKPVAISYENLQVPGAYRIDLLVEDKVIVELKTVETILAVHKAQLLTYMRLAGKRLGLLISFNTALLKDGVTRMVL